MSSTQVKSAYDAIATPYADWVRAGKLIHQFVMPYVLALLGPIKGQTVLDLACGEGIMARALAQAGAHTWGVDLSEQLLELAQQEEARQPLGITYLQDDAHTLKRLEEARFDAVVCNMALTDLADLTQAAHAIAHVLRPGGGFVFSMPHPCFQTAPGAVWGQHPTGTMLAQVADYFAEGPHPTGWSGGLVETYHRTLETLLNTFAWAGLVVTRIAEPQAPLDFRPGYDQLPGVLIGRCLKLAPNSKGAPI
jgi:2-polyprenyl-3-methyl-5-hydroxy-6-metoxy-1,4-benzoquinol methylase